MSVDGKVQPMDQVNLRLDDAPLIVSTIYVNAEVSITWTKQTSFAVPNALSKKHKETYEEKMGWILRQYHALQKQDDLRSIAPHVLPYAAKVGLELQAPRHELLQSIQFLQQTPTEYTFQLAQSLSDSLNVPKLISATSEMIDQKAGLVRDRKRVRLVSAQPLNEFELITADLYKDTTISWHDLKEAQDALTYKQKEQQLQQILRFDSLPSTLHYRFEVVAEPQIMRELKNKLAFAAVGAQEPTPAHGYNVPKVNDGGMIERCFDMSYELYSILQQAQPEAAPLACLYGHRQRYIVDILGPTLKALYDRNIKLSTPAINVVKFLRKEIELKHQTIGSWFKDKEKNESVKGRGEASSSKE